MSDVYYVLLSRVSHLSSELDVLIAGMNPYGGVQPLVLSSPLLFDDPFRFLTGLGELSHFIMNFSSAINSSLKETWQIVVSFSKIKRTNTSRGVPLM